MCSGLQRQAYWCGDSTAHLLPACLSACQSVFLCVFFPVSLSACLSVCLSFSLSSYLSLNLSVCWSVFLPVSLSACLSACLFACLSVCLSVSLSVQHAILSAADELDACCTFASLPVPIFPWSCDLAAHQLTLWPCPPTTPKAPRGSCVFSASQRCCVIVATRQQ